MAAAGVQAGMFAVSAALSLLLVPLAARVAVRTGVLDSPGGHKVQPAPVPQLGGVAIAVAFAATAGAALLAQAPAAGTERLAVGITLALGLALLGLADDLWCLPVALRLLAAGGAAGALVAAGMRLQVVGTPLVDVPLTVLWVVGITNALNLLDNMDGLSAGVAAIAAGWFCLLAGAGGQVLLAGVAAALAGCALGFLRHNFHPARVYMGDAGSLFLGFMLAVFGMEVHPTVPGPASLLVAGLVLAVPVTDTTVVVLARLRAGRGVFVGGRDHLSHRLVASGLSVPTAVSALYLAAVLLGGVAVAVSAVTS